MQFSYASRKKTIFHLAFFKYTGIIKKWIKLIVKINYLSVCVNIFVKISRIITILLNYIVVPGLFLNVYSYMFWHLPYYCTQVT